MKDVYNYKCASILSNNRPYSNKNSFFSVIDSKNIIIAKIVIKM